MVSKLAGLKHLGLASSAPSCGCLWSPLRGQGLSVWEAGRHSLVFLAVGLHLWEESSAVLVGGFAGPGAGCCQYLLCCLSSGASAGKRTCRPQVRSDWEEAPYPWGSASARRRTAGCWSGDICSCHNLGCAPGTQSDDSLASPRGEPGNAKVGNSETNMFCSLKTAAQARVITCCCVTTPN